MSWGEGGEFLQRVCNLLGERIEKNQNGRHNILQAIKQKEIWHNGNIKEKLLPACDNENFINMNFPFLNQ